MIVRLRALAVAVVLFGLEPVVAPGLPAGPGALRRFAMAVGSNDGGAHRVRLRYAVSDARSVLAVFRELGEVAGEDSRLLSDPTARAFFAEMDGFRAAVSQARRDAGRIEVFFYYSGHADDGGLFLGEERIPFPTLRESLESLEAEVRIIILDSCASGAFTRPKGGKKRLPFLYDSAYDMKGSAVMTSSSSEETSQESDLIRGSFFTHYLVSGMRGAADATRDGRVTLSEAYQFAFSETLAQTARASGGPQHPNYAIEMSGTGDVILTDIRRGTAVLVLSEDIDGRVFVHNRAGRLAVETDKPAGRRVEIGLEEGDYRIVLIPKEGQVLEAGIALAGVSPREIAAAAFTQSAVRYTTPRGDLQERLTRNALLNKAKPRLFLELNSRFGSGADGSAVIMGGGAGVTFGRQLTLGGAGYGMVKPVGWRTMPEILGAEDGSALVADALGYGGLFLAWSFFPTRTVHLRATALAGAGVETREAGLEGRLFFVIEPGVDLVVNLSSMFRMTAGLRRPFTDVAGDLGRFYVNFGFQIGK